MTNLPVVQRSAWPAVALLTIVWVLGVLASVWRVFAIGMAGWADQQSDSGIHSAELHHRAVAAATVLVCVSVGGLMLIAIAAFASRMAQVGTAYVVVAMALGTLALTVAASTHHTQAPSSPPASEPVACQEHSGGDNRCPGD